MKAPTAMFVREMTQEACQDVLLRAHVGSLACARAGQPYIVPISVNYTNGCLYGFSTFGRKIEWMRENPLVGIKVEEIVSTRAWISVVASGRYEELPDTSEWQSERMFAWTLVQRTPNWWQPGSFKLDATTGAEADKPVWYRIALTDITGRHAEEPAGEVSAHEVHKGWLKDFLESRQS